MKNKWNATGVTIIGVLLVLPLLGINQLGNLTEGITAWIVALIVLGIGISGLIKSFK